MFANVAILNRIAQAITVVNICASFIGNLLRAKRPSLPVQERR
jgi:hypothetical protein